ncbi:MAG: hypothetical protein ABUK01_12960 [Leptospirales bacterium]
MNRFSLTDHKEISVKYLSATLKDATNSYNFFWLLSILEHIQQGKGERVATEILFTKMVSQIWYPVNYFKLSFGRFDQLAKFVKTIKENSLHSDFQDETDRNKAFQLIHDVPGSFLAPWSSKESTPLYQFNENGDEIILDPEWLSFLKHNGEIIRGSIYLRNHPLSDIL